MEDIEDLLVGDSAAAPPGFRLPITAAVGINPIKKKNKSIKLEPSSLLQNSSTYQVPGTQTIFLKTFGCSHNQDLIKPPQCGYNCCVRLDSNHIPQDLNQYATTLVVSGNYVHLLCVLFCINDAEAHFRGMYKMVPSDSEYMAGQLSAFGYAISDNAEGADLWLINTCTVKSPSQSAMDTLISKCKSAKKPLVVAGCVPQGSRDLKELEGVSVVGVQQIDRVVEVVEETLKGHEVRLLNRKTLPALDLPKVRKNKFVEILPINVGCLGACTYCKTKHARGHLGSYTVDSLVGRVKSVVNDGVKEIWLSSEDTGAYGRDIGVNLPILLNAIVTALPTNGSTMLRIGMTNPPYILEHLKEIAEILCHPCVYSFLHVPVQSGSDAILTAMHREYTVGEFRKVVDTLTELVPGMQIATDIICGFPGETDEDAAQTVDLIKDYKFSQVHISQFYPRPGTPAARMKKVPSNIVKKRSRELTSVFESFTPYDGMEGNIERIWITDIATDEIHLVGHTKGYVQVLVVGPESLLGSSAIVKITSVGRWSVFGDVIEILDDRNGVTSPSDEKDTSIKEKCVEDTCGCSSTKPEPCACESEACEPNGCNIAENDSHPEDQNGRNVEGLLLRKKPSRPMVELEDNGNQKLANVRDRDWGLLDTVLVGGIFMSLLMIVVIVLYVGS